MRAGVVTKWFNRGQPVVGRYLRSALDELGHETFVLARPKKERGPMPGALASDDVWDQPGVTEGSSYDIPGPEYEGWVADNRIGVVFCDQNYQFDEVRRLRERGVRTVGRFVWEHFSAEHVEGALAAYDVVYSFTRAEQARYRELGIESPYVTWGCHPELVAVGQERLARLHPTGPGGEAEEPGGSDLVRMIFPGGFLGHRKPVEQVIEAFTRTSDQRLRLLVKTQVKRKQLKPVLAAAEGDDRIEVLVEDEATADHLRRFAANDVCVAPARWEGLGLPLYESMAFGMPVITNDDPPLNEAVHDGVNGLLVSSTTDGETTRSGIPVRTPDVASLAEAIERLADDDLRAKLAAGQLRLRDGERAWSHTVAGIGALAEGRDP
jgi:1,2-diacylglycerol 3-alpha-glucosyltransferase